MVSVIETLKATRPRISRKR